MATKKSSSASKKKAAPKKQATKKKVNTVTKKSNRETSNSLYKNEESVQASLQSAVSPGSDNTPEKSESGNGIYLFLVLAGVAAIGYLGYAKYNSKKNPTNLDPSKVEAPAKVDQKSPVVAEVPTAPEEAAKASALGYAVDKIGTGKTWSESSAYCKETGGKVPSLLEFRELFKTSAKEFNAEKKYWTREDTEKKKTLAFSFKTGKSSTTLKSEKHDVLCKN